MKKIYTNNQLTFLLQKNMDPKVIKNVPFKKTQQNINIAIERVQRLLQ